MSSCEATQTETILSSNIGHWKELSILVSIIRGAVHSAEKASASSCLAFRHLEALEQQNTAQRHSNPQQSSYGVLHMKTLLTVIRWRSYIPAHCRTKGLKFVAANQLFPGDQLIASNRVFQLPVLIFLIINFYSIWFFLSWRIFSASEGWRAGVEIVFNMHPKSAKFLSKPQNALN